MEHVAQIPLRRALDRSRRRKPLRVRISRRVVRKRDGRDRYVTQVRLGKERAVLIPWDIEPATESEQP
jgi:hypothetical protein